MLPLLFLIPGTLCDRQLWRYVEGPLQQRYRVVHLDIPPHGNMESVVNALSVQIVDISGVHPFSLLGFSMGGYLAAAIATSSYTNLQRLMIMANLPKALPSKELFEREQVTQLITKLGYRGVSRSRVQQLLHTTRRKDDGLISLIREMDSHFGVEQVVQQLSALAVRQNLCPLLDKLSIPVWLCHGEQDHLVDISLVSELVQGSENLHHVIVESCAHMLPLEQPKIFVETVEKWLES